MSAALTLDERDELAASARALLDRESSSSRVRTMIYTADGADPALTRQMAQLGWLGLLVPDSHGGAGAGIAEVVVVAEELGGHLTPGPFLASAVLATSALVLAGRDEQQARWLPGLAAGDATGTAALTGPSGRLECDLIDVTIRHDGAGLRLDGVAGFVPDAHLADILVIAARDDDRVRLVLVERGAVGLTVEPTPTIDRTRRLATVTLDGITIASDALLGGDAPGSGPPVPGAIDVIDALVDRALVVLAADAAGAARSVLALAVEYAKQRVQFGRPIGSFQAVKHTLANMFVRTEAALAAVEGAAEALDSDPATARRAVAVAASYARDAAVRVAGDAVQVHGGIGFTWEHDCHLYLKRTTLDAALLGDSATHRERLAALVLADAREAGRI